MSNETPEYLLWLDFETTGLDITDVPIEVAAVVTTADTLEELDGYRTLIWADPAKVAACAAHAMHEAMPGLAARLTYHVHDVGVMRRAYRRAAGHDLTERTEPAHRAMADVQQSLTEGRAFAELFRSVE